ncbi:MAG: hypothetical protein EXQ53_05540 [Acidobacteria bacterium]|nr:hypothetical protein [Acidobacteriota bacterium]
MDHNQEKRRGHFHRGRRGPNRGQERRPPQAQAQAQERPGRDQVDVEQIMRDIRGRIAQRQGIDLSNQQIQDLAARRLESILDPRAIKPSLLEALRRTAGAPGARSDDKVPNEPAFTFEDSTIYDSHRGALRLMRRLLNPLLKLLFNPNPLIRALHLQARLNVEAAERDAERDRRQTEWNALQYEIVQRLVTETSRVSLELQALSMRVESLDAKVDFNERRVRGIEGSAHRSRPQGRPAEPVFTSPAASPVASPVPSPVASPGPTASPVVESEAAPAGAVTATVAGQPSDGTRRRRRRRRGRRLGNGPGDAAAPMAAQLSPGGPAALSDTQAEPQPAVERLAQDAGAASAPHAPAPLFPPPAPDERAAPEPPAGQPDADRTEP